LWSFWDRVRDSWNFPAVTLFVGWNVEGVVCAVLGCCMDRGEEEKRR
jgi:hypothetical protein